MEVQTQDYILGHFQPSLAGLVLAGKYTQHCVLGYSQPVLSKLGFMNEAESLLG